MTATATSLDFAAAARGLGRSARVLGLNVPTFRSPPRIAGVDRSIRRSRSGWVTVSVRLVGRPLVAVLADMVEGVIVANRMSGAEATRVRTTLWESMAPVTGPPGPTAVVGHAA